MRAIVIAVLLAAIGASATAGQDSDRQRQAPLVGNRAPDFRLPMFDSTSEPGVRLIASRDTLRLSDLTGKPVVLNFWYVACPPCIEENPRLSKLAGSLKGQVHFLGINTSDRPQEVLAYLRRTRGITYPVLFARGSRIEADYGVVGAPTTVVISKRGIVVGKVFGTVEDEELKKMIEEAGR